MAGFKVLVTGFGRYGNTKTNPARAVVQDVQKLFSLESGLITDSFSDLAGLPKPDVDVVAVEVPCEFFACLRVTEALIAEHSPNAVVLLGESRRRSMITLERVAINFNDATRYGLADEAGVAPQGTPIAETGPAAYLSTLPLRRCVTDLRAGGIPADISGDAGTLMCNHLMYGVLHHLATTGAADVPAGFVHLPALPETAALEKNLGMPSMTTELCTRAVMSIADSLAAAAKAGGGDIDVAVKSRLLV